MHTMRGYRLSADLHKTQLYRALAENDVDKVKTVIADADDKWGFRFLTTLGETYLHLAIQLNVKVEIIKELIPVVRIGQRNSNCKTALEIVLESQSQYNIDEVIQHHIDFILNCIKDGEYDIMEELVLDGWSIWPTRNVPELHNFHESFMYLTPNTLHSTIIPVPRLKTAAYLSMSDKPYLRDRRDLLGMNILHKLAINKDIDTFMQLVLFEEMLLCQDNMGRTPIHYIGAYGENSSEWIQLMDFDVTALKNAFEITDKKGSTAVDYAQGKSKLDVKKVRNLCTAVEKYTNMRNLLEYIIDELKENFHLKPASTILLKEMTFNSEGKPITDIAGRNLLHKLVFRNEDSLISKIPNIDPDCLLLKGTDIWGRTPLHYSSLVHNDMDQKLLDTLKNLPQSFAAVASLKNLKDNFGDTYEDIKRTISKEDAEVLFHKTNKINELLDVLPKIQECQNVVARMILEEQKTTSSHTKESHFLKLFGWKSILEFIKDFEKMFKSNSKKYTKLLMFMQLPTGSPLGFYLMLHQSEVLQHIKWESRIYTDHLGRNSLHYASYLQAGANIRGALERQEFVNSDTTDCSDSTEDDVSSSDEHSTSTDDENASPSSNSSTASVKKRSYKEAVTRYKKKSLRARPDLKYKLPENYAKEINPFGSIQIIFSQLEKSIQQKTMAKQIDSAISIPQHTFNVKDQQNSVKVQPQTTQPKLANTTYKGINSLPDSEYLKTTVGKSLSVAMATLMQIKPTDPIEFLAHFLYKHAQNTTYQESKIQHDKELTKERKNQENERSVHTMLKTEKEQLLCTKNRSEEEFTHADSIKDHIDSLDSETESKDEKPTSRKRRGFRKIERQLSGIYFQIKTDL